jgi:hypothetical protein
MVHKVPSAPHVSPTQANDCGVMSGKPASRAKESRGTPIPGVGQQLGHVDDGFV